MKNLGNITDFIFHQRDGKVIDRGDYYLVRTPSNPTYFWGNSLLFKSEPVSGSFEKWMTIHRQEFGSDPAHIAIGWDSHHKGDSSEFEANGFELNQEFVLSLSGSPTTVRTNPDLVIRKITRDWEWRASTELQIAEGFSKVSEADYRIYQIAQMANYRLTQDRGHGHWWGAFLGNELVGDMGLFFDDAGKIGRFQNVSTAKAHRRKRVCTTLLDTIVRHSLAQPGVEQLVIVCDQGSVAETIYRSLGFTRETSQFGLCRVEKPVLQDS